MSRMDGYPSVDRIRQLLTYDRENGTFSWLKARGRQKEIAGRLITYGYRQIQIDGRLILAHQLVWFMEKGVWPASPLDHINGIPGDNRIQNLREASVAQNAWNKKRPSTNTSGYKGVSWVQRDGKWLVQIKANGKRHHVGLFRDLDEAAMAYAAAAYRHYGEFARPE
jgi:hypothetical protein